MSYFIDISDDRNVILMDRLKEKNLPIYTLDEKSVKDIKPKDILIFSPAKKLSVNDLESFPNDITLYCGNIDGECKSIIDEKNIQHKNFMTDEIFAIKNAELTSEGILALILEKSQKSIYENNILFFGAGRITKTTALLFSKLGIRFSICNYRVPSYENAHIFTNNCFLADEYKDHAKEFDIIVNTIPHCHLSREDTMLFNNGTLYIETASVNGLDTNNYENLVFVHAPGLPKKYSKISASTLLQEFIERN